MTDERIAEEVVAELDPAAREEEVEFAPDIQDFEEHSMVGFPQPPQAEDAAFDASMEEEESVKALEEEPTVHVLEWDMEEDADEVAAEHLEEEPTAGLDEEEMFLQSSPAMSMEPETEETPVALSTEESEEPEAPLEAPSWDLFSTSIEPEEEEIELTFIEDESEVETAPTATSDAGTDSIFDAPAPAPMEQPQGMIQEDSHAGIPEALEAPIEEKMELAAAELAPTEEEGTSFTLDDIEGDGFTLEVQDWEPAAEAASGTPSADQPVEETSYDAFEMSLGDMGLGAKAEQESLEHSFTVPSPEFEREAFVSEIKVEEVEDPIMSFEIKQREEPAPATEAPESVGPAVDMDLPLSQMPSKNLSEMPNKVKDRISRLQSFQYQFKANQQNLEEAERIPAYMRQGVEVDLNHKSTEQPSNVGVDAEGNLRTNNSFLHDNVD